MYVGMMTSEELCIALGNGEMLVSTSSSAFQTSFSIFFIGFDESIVSSV